MTNITCPACGGDKSMIATCIRYAPGHGGPPVLEMPCFRCDGRGEITPEHMERIKVGRELREYRRDTLGLGLREASERFGMRPSELSALEQGDADNKNWKELVGL